VSILRIQATLFHATTVTEALSFSNMQKKGSWSSPYDIIYT